jgi:hypothetical protein
MTLVKSLHGTVYPGYISPLLTIYGVGDQDCNIKKTKGENLTKYVRLANVSKGAQVSLVSHIV